MGAGESASLDEDEVGGPAVTGVGKGAGLLGPRR